MRATAGEPPGAGADRFQQGEFDKALDLVNQAIPTSENAKLTADLLSIKGRCYWELAHKADVPDSQKLLLNQALQALTASIEATDNAEVRHVRSMVYEVLGEPALSNTDKTVARQLDESYRMPLSE